MGSPPYWSRLSGHGLVHHLLSIIIDTIEDFLAGQSQQRRTGMATVFGPVMIEPERKPRR
jgi:hypothetical protein